MRRRERRDRRGKRRAGRERRRRTKKRGRRRMRKRREDEEKGREEEEERGEKGVEEREENWGGTHQHIDCTAHTVVDVVIYTDYSAVVKETLHEFSDKFHKTNPFLLQQRVTRKQLVQTAKQTKTKTNV